MRPSPLAARLMRLGLVSASDLRCLGAYELRNQSLPRLTYLFGEGTSAPPKAYALSDGWAACEKQLPDGRVQIVDFALPGDIIGLCGLLMGEINKTAFALSPLCVTPFTREDLREIEHRHPRLYSALLTSKIAQQRIIEEHLLNVGRRNPLERTACFLLEYYYRMRTLDLLSADGSFCCPATQAQIAGLLGLSAVHVNRTLKKLREQGLASFQHGAVKIADPGALAEIAGFDLAFLDPDYENSRCSINSG